MADYITRQVEELFTDHEQWESFLELCGQKNNLCNAWWQGFISKMNKCFIVDRAVENWNFTALGGWNFKWFLKDYGPESLCLWSREWYSQYSLGLWVNPSVFDNLKISNMLQDSRYLPLISVFDSHDAIGSPENPHKVVELWKYEFDTQNSGPYGFDQVSWFAHYKADPLLEETVKKIDRFRKNTEITGLLGEINKLAKRG
jgi:hypothetical protein